VTRRSAERRGLTLLEQLVATSLLTLLMTLCWQVVKPNLDVWKVNAARADLEQTAVVLQHRIARELRQSSRDSITTLSSPPAISFLSFDDASSSAYDSSTGKPTWRKFVIYYVDTDNRIMYRKEYPDTAAGVQTPLLPVVLPSSNAFKLTTTQLQSICGTENGTETRVAWYVLGVTVTVPTSGAVTLDLQLTTESPAGMELADRQLDLTLRN